MSSDAGADDAAAPEGKADARMVSQWRSRNAAQCKRIAAAVQNNLELQQLVLSTIETYENSQKIAKHQGCSISDLTKKRSKTDLEEGPAVSDPDKLLGKGKLSYKSWPKKWYSELLCYMEDAVEPSEVDLLPKDRLAEICERGLELQFLGETPDRASNPKLTKTDIFERLKAVYMANGRPLQSIKGEFSQGYVNWEANGMYSLEVRESGDCGAPVLKLTCNPVKKQITMDPDSMPEDEGPFKLIANYSLANAAVQGEKGAYRCQNYFAVLGRRLKRNLSETLGLVEEPSAKKAARPSTMGSGRGQASDTSKPAAAAAAVEQDMERTGPEEEDEEPPKE